MKRGFLQINLAVLLWGFTAILGKAISLAAPVRAGYRMILAFCGLPATPPDQGCTTAQPW